MKASPFLFLGVAASISLGIVLYLQSPSGSKSEPGKSDHLTISRPIERAPASLPGASVSPNVSREPLSSGSAPSFDDANFNASEPPGTPLQKESRLADAVHLVMLQDQIEIQQRALLEKTAPLWPEYWDSGQFQTVDKVSPDLLVDDQGKPRPIQTRMVNGELRMVVLPQDRHPEVWSDLENLHNLRSELKSLEASLAVDRKRMSSNGPVYVQGR